MTPEQRILRARIGGLTTSARGHVNTAPARAAFLDRFYRDIPENLPAAERDRRAAAARRLHFSRLALASSRIRSKKAGPGRSESREPATSAEGTHDARTATG